MPSLASRLTQGAGIGQYARLSAVQATARALGCQPSTAAQELRVSDPRCSFIRAAMISEALYQHGHGTRADALLLPLDLVRLGAVEPASPEAFAAALEAEQQAEGAQTVAQLFIGDAASYATWRKRAAMHVTAILRAFRLGDALYGRGA